jgi:hypothetical protein
LSNGTLPETLTIEMCAWVFFNMEQDLGVSQRKDHWLGAYGEPTFVRADGGAAAANDATAAAGASAAGPSVGEGFGSGVDLFTIDTAGAAPDYDYLDSEGSYVRLDPTASDAGLYLLPPQFLANRTFDTITWEGAVEAARQAREERGGGMMAGVGNAAALSNARSADPAIVGMGANTNWAQLSAAPNTAAAGADNDTAAVDTGAEAAAAEGDEVFTGITSQEECDAVSVAVSLGEHEEQVHALEAADAAVGVGVANFNGNGGFDHSRRGSQMGHHGEEEQRDNGEPNPGGSIDV